MTGIGIEKVTYKAFEAVHTRIEALEARLDAIQSTLPSEIGKEAIARAMQADPLPPPPDKPHKYGGNRYDDCTICGHGQYHEIHSDIARVHRRPRKRPTRRHMWRA